MSNIPKELKYTKSHEWVRKESEGVYVVGITGHAQSLLGDIVFVDLPEKKEVKAGDECCVVESVKAASDIYAPISGTIIETNADLENEADLINKDAYGKGWIFKIKSSNASDIDGLLSAEAYGESIEE